MFEEYSLAPYEWYLLYFLVLFAFGPFVFMLAHKHFGSFLLGYGYGFVFNVLWGQFHGFSETDAQHAWAENSASFLKIKTNKVKGSKEIYTGDKKTMFLVNHSGMSDFVIMDLVLEARANALARVGIILFVPFLIIVIVYMYTLWLFRRGGRGDDLEGFFKWIDNNFDWFVTNRYHLLIFPEGHRNRKPYMLPLKEGMIRYAYERKLNIQPIIGFGAENVLSEYTFQRDLSKGINLEYSAGDILNPRDFKTRKEFFDNVQSAMFSHFDQVHSKICPENQRFSRLKDPKEKELFENAKETERSQTMLEYVLAKKKKKHQ